MSLKWVWEFPGALIDTFVENAKKNLPEFVGEVKSGVTSIAKGTGDVVSAVISPLRTPLILIAVIGVLLLIFWKKIGKMVGI